MPTELVDGKSMMTRLVRAASGGVAFVGLAIGAFGLTRYAPLDNYPWRILLFGAGVGVVLFLALLGAALLVKRLVSQTFPIRALFTPMTALALLVVGGGVVAAINGAFDLQGPQEHETVVVGKYQREGSNSAAFFKVRDFRSGREGELLTVEPGGLFDQVSEGDRIIVVAGQGLFEWWFEEFRLAGEPRQPPSIPPSATPPATPDR